MTVYSYFEFLKRARSVSPEVVIDEGIGSFNPNVDQIKEELENLNQNRTAPPEYSRCSIHYQIYKEIRGGNKGRRFDKETFFLDWLASQIRLSKLNVVKKIVYKTASGKGVYQYSIEPRQMVRGLWRSISDFIRRELPGSGINARPGRIRLKLWRFRKSGIWYRVERALIGEREKILGSQPGRLKESKKEWKRLRFIYRVGDLIRKRPDGASKREILRQFSNKRASDLDEISDILEYDFGIKFEEAGRGKGRYFWNGQGFGFPYFEAHKDDF